MANPVRKRVSVVVPCYNEEGSIGPFLDRVGGACGESADYEFEILFVDDGSGDGTGKAILSRAGQDPRIKLVTLSRNFGHQRAITAGLDFCSGDYIIVIDADLQDPPELIPQILGRLEEGNDLVHMARSDRRVDSPAKRASARVFYAVMRRYVLPELPEDAADFKGFNRRVLDALRRYPERVRFLRGMFATLGFKQVTIPYVRETRRAGASKYSLRKVLAFGRDAMVSFSVIPLRLGLAAGTVACVGAAGFVLAWAGLECLGHGFGDPLLVALIALVSGFSGLILILLGVMGEYLGCLIREVKQRPLYLVESVYNLDPRPGASHQQKEE